MKKISVYCAASNNVDSIYLDSAYEFGQKLALSNIDIYYGGGNLGLMGHLADGSLRMGGKVYGIIPNFLVDLELEHKGITQSIRVNSMHERQAKLIENADAIVALPGGIGTFAELTEAIAWRKLNLINCPIYIVNLNNYYDEFIMFLKKAIDNGFMRKNDFDLWRETTSIDETIANLNREKDIFINYDMA